MSNKTKKIKDKMQTEWDFHDVTNNHPNKSQWIEECPRCGGTEWSIPEYICDKCHWQDPTVAQDNPLSNERSECENCGQSLNDYNDKCINHGHPPFVTKDESGEKCNLAHFFKEGETTCVCGKSTRPDFYPPEEKKCEHMFDPKDGRCIKCNLRITEWKYGPERNPVPTEPIPWEEQAKTLLEDLEKNAYFEGDPRRTQGTNIEKVIGFIRSLLASEREKVLKLVSDEIAIAHTKDAGGKTSRLTSLYMKITSLYQ